MVYSAIYINSYWCRIHTNKALHIPAQPTSSAPPTQPSLIKLNQITCIEYDLGGKCKIDFGL